MALVGSNRNKFCKRVGRSTQNAAKSTKKTTSKGTKKAVSHAPGTTKVKSSHQGARHTCRTKKSRPTTRTKCAEHRQPVWVKNVHRTAHSVRRDTKKSNETLFTGLGTFLNRVIELLPDPPRLDTIFPAKPVRKKQRIDPSESRRRRMQTEFPVAFPGLFLVNDRHMTETDRHKTYNAAKSHSKIRTLDTPFGTLLDTSNSDPKSLPALHFGLLMNLWSPKQTRPPYTTVHHSSRKN
ncbi:MAG: hypothetical protein ACI9BD_001286 [Candidatus Marinamargulisbacteria bacterium]|jgi:hypothetical protein